MKFRVVTEKKTLTIDAEYCRVESGAAVFYRQVEGGVLGEDVPFAAFAAGEWKSVEPENGAGIIQEGE